MQVQTKSYQFYFWMRELLANVETAKLRSVRHYNQHFYVADGYIMAKIPRQLINVDDYIDTHFTHNSLDVQDIVDLARQFEETGWLPCADNQVYDFKNDGDIRLEPERITKQDFSALVWSFYTRDLWDKIAVARTHHYLSNHSGFASMKIGRYPVNTDYVQWMLQLPCLIAAPKVVVTSVAGYSNKEVMPLKFDFEGTGIEIYLMSTYS